MADAMPFLKAAAEVIVQGVCEDVDAEIVTRETEDVAVALRRHGIKASASVSTAAKDGVTVELQRVAAAAGADGLLILDLPPDEAARNAELMKSHGLLSIRLIAPTTPPERMELIAKSAEGFIYYVSREGVTGEQTSLSADIATQVAEIKKHTSLPVAVGFGISTPEQAAEVAKESDAVVVGSAIVRRIGEHGKSAELIQKVAQFVSPIAAAVKKAAA